MARIDEFAWRGPVFLKSAAPADIRSLGRIVSESSEVVANPNAEGTITYRIFRLDGLEVRQRSFGSPAQHQLVSVTVASDKWTIKDGLNVGAPVSRVVKILGTPSKRGDAALEYMGESESVVFRTKHNRIVRVEFIYYAD
jgi:hypothetical protein